MHSDRPAPSSCATSPRALVDRPGDGSSAGADRELVRRALRGDADALGAVQRVLAEVHPRVRHENRLRNRPLAWDEELDVGQAIVVTVWSKLGSFEGRSSFRTWVLGFVRVQVLHAVAAKRSRRVHDGPSALRDVPAPDEPARRGEVRREVRAALARVDPAVARVIALHHGEGLPFPEIAGRLGLGVSAAKSRYYRALPRLRRALSHLLE